MIRFDLDPVPRPRMSQRDKWKKRPVVVDYRDYCDDLRTLAMVERWEPGDALWLQFVLPLFPSYSKKKKRELAGQPHRQKPDLDNLVKGFLDAFGEDKAIYRVDARKLWSEYDDDQGIQPGYVLAHNLEGAEGEVHL